MDKFTVSSPSTYAQWMSVIDNFKNKVDDESTLATMQRGTIEWQTGVAERFSKKLIDAVNYRLNAATDKFQKDMSRSRGQEAYIVQALLSLRKELIFLSKSVDLPVIPETDRKHYKKLIMDQANTIQASLEDSAKTDRSGKLSSIIRNHRVNSL